MNKLDVSPHALTLISTVHLDENPGPRLIVLFPASETDSPDLSHRIWEIARSSHLNVLLFGLSNTYEEETQLRRKLVTLAAMITDPFISTEIVTEHGNDWVGQVRNIWRAGDIVACYAGQKVGILRKPLDQVLKSSLETTIYILSDYQPAGNRKPTFTLQLSFWLGSLGILLGFLWTEMKIVHLPQDWAHNALLYLAIFVEVSLLWVWNSIFG